VLVRFLSDGSFMRASEAALFRVRTDKALQAAPVSSAKDKSKLHAALRRFHETQGGADGGVAPAPALRSSPAAAAAVKQRAASPADASQFGSFGLLPAKHHTQHAHAHAGGAAGGGGAAASRKRAAPQSGRAGGAQQPKKKKVTFASSSALPPGFAAPTPSRAPSKRAQAAHSAYASRGGAGAGAAAAAAKPKKKTPTPHAQHPPPGFVTPAPPAAPAPPASTHVDLTLSDDDADEPAAAPPPPAAAVVDAATAAALAALPADAAALLRDPTLLSHPDYATRYLPKLLSPRLGVRSVALAKELKFEEDLRGDVGMPLALARRFQTLTGAS
jgi:hypothetical protein